jgi:SAM-dependent methyltransferase
VNTVAKYYASKLAQHGATPAGVDWNSEESQRVRFDQFMELISDRQASVCDYGCGYGAFLGYLRARGHQGEYVGFDVADAMIREARTAHEADHAARFTSVRDDVAVVDFTIASGIFNVRLTTPADEWRTYVDETIRDLASLSRRGFGFNVLSSYSDPERRRGDLHYADPREVFDQCMERWPRRVALVHDYDLYEFTVTVRL